MYKYSFEIVRRVEVAAPNMQNAMDQIDFSFLLDCEDGTRARLLETNDPKCTLKSSNVGSWNGVYEPGEEAS